MAEIGEIRKKLEAHGQSHLLAFYEELPSEHRELLLEQIQGINFDQLEGWIERYVRRPPRLEVPQDIQPPETVPNGGLELLGAGKVAAFTVAGGQGTRLGYEGPKGCLPASPVVKKPPFRLFAEQIRAAALREGASIPWYILTSPTNDTATRAHFRQNAFWGFDPGDVMFIKQGTIPAIDFEGRLMLDRKYQLAVNPDGHGGSLIALCRSGALDDMARRGIEQISYFQVDNPLVRCIDPLFLGLHELNAAEMSAKSLPKRSPMEKLGNFCLIDGKVCVIEYSDMPEALGRACNMDGRLKFSAGSIAVHIFSRSFVERLTAEDRYLLPLHRAEKKVPYVDLRTGQVVQPTSPNAVKLEKFIFDAMPMAPGAVVLETVRSEEFSPVKSATGVDSLVTSLHDQIRRAADWLEAAGVAVPRDAQGHVASPIEISPLYALDAEQLAEKVDPKLTIRPQQELYLE